MRPLPRDPSPSHREASARAPNARAHKRFVPRTTDGLRFRAFKPDPALVGCMSGSEISAPASTFLSGLGKTLGYNVEADGERLAIAFEPWSLEHEDAFEVPCLRLQSRPRLHRPDVAQQLQPVRMAGESVDRLQVQLDRQREGLPPIREGDLAGLPLNPPPEGAL